MAPDFHKSVPIGHGESILFIYRVLFAVPPRYAYSSVEALAGLLFIPILFRILPRVKRNSSTVHTLPSARFKQDFLPAV